jgi:zinc D-Ala-D-Ala carboxypeptidase
VNRSPSPLQHWGFFLLFMTLGLVVLRSDWRFSLGENRQPQPNEALAAATPKVSAANVQPSPSVSPPVSPLASPVASPPESPLASPPMVAVAPSPVPASLLYDSYPDNPQPAPIVPSQVPDRLPVYGHLAYAEASVETLLAVGDYQGRSEYLRSEAAAAFGQMVQAAAAEGIQLVPISGFRDRALQSELFEAQIARRGSEVEAARISAPPGHSEHHTGYAIDIGDRSDPATDTETTFEQTPAYGWLRQNASQFGFEMSFPDGNAQGINYEPWHWRFVASPQSNQVFNQARR